MSSWSLGALSAWRWFAWLHASHSRNNALVVDLAGSSAPIRLQSAASSSLLQIPITMRKERALPEGLWLLRCDRGRIYQGRRRSISSELSHLPPVIKIGPGHMQGCLLQCRVILGLALIGALCWEMVCLLMALCGWDCCCEGQVSVLKRHLVQTLWGDSSFCPGQQSALMVLGCSGGSLTSREGAGLYCTTWRSLILARSPAAPVCRRGCQHGPFLLPGGAGDSLLAKSFCCNFCSNYTIFIKVLVSSCLSLDNVHQVLFSGAVWRGNSQVAWVSPTQPVRYWLYRWNLNLGCSAVPEIRQWECSSQYLPLLLEWYEWRRFVK